MIRTWIVFLGILVNLPGVVCQTVNNTCQCDSFDKTMFEPLLSGDVLQTINNVIGSQYYYDWDDANVKLYTGETAYHKKVRYNGLLNEMVLLIPGENILVKLDKSRIKEVYFNTTHALFRHMSIVSSNNYLRNADDSTIFAEVLLENKISMYAYRHVVLNTSEVHHYANNTYLFDHVIPEMTYYIKLPDQQAFIKINKINKRSFADLFPARKNEVRKLLRDNNVSIKSETDFVKVLILTGKTFY